MEQQMIYTYTSAGFLLSEELLDYDGTLLEKRTFEPDSNNVIACELMHYADGSVDRIKYFRDSQSRITCKEYYNDEDSLEFAETMEYDGDKLIKEQKTDAEGNILAASAYSFNEEGKLTEVVINNPEEVYWMKKTYAYDDNGALAMVTSYNNSDEPVERLSYVNDEFGRPVRVTEENQRQKNTTELEYNEKGDILFQVEHDRHGQLIRQLEKNYDESGLLTETEILIRDFHTGISRSYKLTNKYFFFEKQTD